MIISTRTKMAFMAFLACIFYLCIPNNNVLADSEMPEYTIISIEENGVELIPETIDDEWQTFNVYNISRSEATLTVYARLNNLKENTTYHFRYDDAFTSEDNGRVVSFNIKPYCWEGVCSASLYLYTDDNGYESFGYQELRFMPQSIGNEYAHVISATQNGVNLDISNGTIKSDNYVDPILVTCELDDYNPNYRYMVDGKEIGSDRFFNKQYTPRKLYRFSNLGSIFVSVSRYNDNATQLWEAPPQGVFSINFEITDPAFVPFDGIIIDSVKQNNTELAFIESKNQGRLVATTNDMQPLTVTFHVDSAVDNIKYSLGVETYSMSAWENNTEYLGSDLKNGVTVTIPAPKKSYGTHYTELYIYEAYDDGRSSSNLSYFYDDRQVMLEFNSTEDTNISRFDEVELKYVNYPNKEISNGVVSPLYHNSDNPLAVIINGRYYDPEIIYPVEVRVLRGVRGGMDDEGEQVFFKSTTISGAELNSSATIPLDDFVMDFMDPDNTLLDQMAYLIYVKIDDLERHGGWDYTYGYIRSVVFHANGQQNAIAGGAGACSARSCFWDTTMSDAAIAGDNSAYIFYVAEDIDLLKIFDYDILYCANSLISLLPDMDSCEKISSGSVSGARLAVGAFAYEIKNPKNYYAPTYIFRLKQGDKVVNEVSDRFDLFSSPGILSAKLSTSLNLYYQKYQFSYVVPRGNEVKISTTGIRFEEGKNYTLKVSLNGNKITPCENNPNYCRTYHNVDLSEFASEKIVSGKELNSGKVKVNIAYDESFAELDNINISLDIFDEDSVRYPGAYISIEYTTLEDIFKTNQSYIMNTIENFIRGISKNTNIADFSNNFIQDNNGSVKVFDKTGETEQSGPIGTGMIIRALDEFGQPIMDTEAVVTGDVSGDGDINTLDLAKERQHLAGIRELEGVYKEAGKITNSDDITPLDLTRIRQDIAGIREIK